MTAAITPTRSLLMALHSPVEMTKSARKAGRPSIKTAWEQCSVRLEIHYSGRYGWLEDIDTPALVLWLKSPLR